MATNRELGLYLPRSHVTTRTRPFILYTLCIDDSGGFGVELVKTPPAGVQVFLSGEAKRFCQQCCGFHDVAAFDGPRRSENVLCCVQSIAIAEGRRSHQLLLSIYACTHDADSQPLGCAFVPASCMLAAVMHPKTQPNPPHRPHRSCRERLAAHKDRQRRKWQASHGRRGSDSASSGGEDEGGADGQDAGQPTTVTRAGRPSRRPSLLRENPKSGGTPDSGTSPERRLPDLKRVSPSAATAADGPFGSSPNASGHGGSYYGSLHGGIGSGCYNSTGNLNQSQQQQRLQPTAFQQALAASRRHSGALPEELQAGAQLRARRSASMSQMQVWFHE